MFGQHYNLQILLCLIISKGVDLRLHPHDVLYDEGKAIFSNKGENKNFFSKNKEKRKSLDSLKLDNVYSPKESTRTRKDDGKRPYWEVRSTQTKSYAYREYLDDDEQEMREGRLEYVELDELNIKNNQNNQELRISYTHSDETTCLHTIELTDDIAMLFDNELNVPKHVFPLCCKGGKSTPERFGQATVHQKTQTFQLSTPFYTGSKTSMTSSRKAENGISSSRASSKNSITISRFTPEISVKSSNDLLNEGGVINLAIQVKCCQTPNSVVIISPQPNYFTTPITVGVQNEIPSLIPLNYKLNVDDSSTVNNKEPGSYSIEEDKPNPNGMKKETSNADHTLIQNTLNSVYQKNYGKKPIPYPEGYLTRRVESEPNLHIGSGRIKESHPKAVQPHKLLPFDITHGTTRRSSSTSNPAKTRKRPIFLCEITSSVKPAKKRPATTPLHGIWKKLSFQHVGTKKNKRFNEVTPPNMVNYHGWVKDHDNLLNTTHSYYESLIPKTTFHSEVMNQIPSKMEDPPPRITEFLRKEGAGGLSSTGIRLEDTTSSFQQIIEKLHPQGSKIFDAQQSKKNEKPIPESGTYQKEPSGGNDERKTLVSESSSDVYSRAHEESGPFYKNKEYYVKTDSEHKSIENEVSTMSGTIIQEAATLDEENSQKTMLVVGKTSEATTSAKNEIQHIIDLSKGKFLFYWRETWYITDQTHVWSFKETAISMNKTFFNHEKTSTTKTEFIKHILEEKGYYRNEELHIVEEMPFEVFLEGILLIDFRSNENFKWGDQWLAYDDIIAMLRFSEFDAFLESEGRNNWGNIYWKSVYDKIEVAPKSKTAIEEEYKIVDFEGVKQSFKIFANGTSTWKGKTLTIMDVVSTVQKLNSILNISEYLVTSSYESDSETFEAYVLNAIKNTTMTKNKYANYKWSGYNFTWEELLAVVTVRMKEDKTKVSNLNVSSIISVIKSSGKEFFMDRLVFSIDAGASSITVFRNNTVVYGDFKVDLTNMTEYLSKPSSKESVSSHISQVSALLTNIADFTYVPVFKNMSEHTKEWEEFKNKKDKSGINEVLYPVNLGGGLIQFYFKSVWYITDGTNLWAFDSRLTNLYISKLASSTNFKFNEDPKIDKLFIQKLVDRKIKERNFDLRMKLVMPFEMIAQHSLFFGRYRNLMDNPLYLFNDLTLGPEDVIASLRLAGGNVTTEEYQLLWSNRTRLNWKWIVQEVNDAKKEKADNRHEYVFTSGVFTGKPNLFVYTNLTSTWGPQYASADNILEQVVKSNSATSFVPVEINTTYDMIGDETFNMFYKAILQKRIHQNLIYKEYDWKGLKFTWHKLLVYIRSIDVLPNSIRDNGFWKLNILRIEKSKWTGYRNRVEYEVNVKSQVEVMIVFMNESTLVKGKLVHVTQYEELYAENYQSQTHH